MARHSKGASFETHASRAPQDDDKGSMPHTNIRHPEERPAGARLEGRSAPVQPSPAIGLARIFGAFLWLGCTSFGGGTAGWLYREMVVKRRWLDDAAFLSDFALGQAIPGSNGVKLTVQIGQRLRGAAGAVVALVGLLAGPFAIIVSIGATYAGFGENRILHQMLDGVAAAVIGLTFATGLHSMTHSRPGLWGVALAAVTVLCVGVLRWPMLPVVAVLAPLGIGLALIEPRRR
jgi:chromate transporter